MKKISSSKLAELCPQIFGVDFESDRLDELVSELTGILDEITKLRKLDLSDVPPVVVFDAKATYREGQND